MTACARRFPCRLKAGSPRIVVRRQERIARHRVRLVAQRGEHLPAQLQSPKATSHLHDGVPVGVGRLRGKSPGGKVLALGAHHWA